MTRCTCFADDPPLGVADHYRATHHGRQCWHVESGVYAAHVGYISDGRTSVVLEEDGELVLSCPGEPTLQAAIDWLMREVATANWPDDLSGAMSHRPLIVETGAYGMTIGADPVDLATSLFG